MTALNDRPVKSQALVHRAHARHGTRPPSRTIFKFRAHFPPLPARVPPLKTAQVVELELINNLTNYQINGITPDSHNFSPSLARQDMAGLCQSAGSQGLVSVSV